MREVILTRYLTIKKQGVRERKRKHALHKWELQIKRRGIILRLFFRCYHHTPLFFPSLPIVILNINFLLRCE